MLAAVHLGPLCAAFVREYPQVQLTVVATNELTNVIESHVKKKAVGRHKARPKVARRKVAAKRPGRKKPARKKKQAARRKK